MFQILIVEDDKELSQLFQKVLEKNGYQVKSASDGAQALEVLDKEYIDLIISDIMMPVMDCLLYTSLFYIPAEQECISTHKVRAQLGIKDDILRGLGMCPVSYTHLDVYKRQVQMYLQTLHTVQ